MYNPSAMSQPAGKLVVHRRSEGATTATLDGFFLMRCYGDLKPEDITATLVAHEAIIGFRPQGSASIVVVDPTCAFPSEEARRVALEAMRTTGHQTLAHVLVVMGDGFWASAVRGVMMTFSSLTKATHPRKVVRYEEEGVDWILSTLGESAPKYRQLILTSLGELKLDATVPSPSKLA
jgi:hypothetical protein